MSDDYIPTPADVASVSETARAAHKLKEASESAASAVAFSIGKTMSYEPLQRAPDSLDGFIVPVNVGYDVFSEEPLAVATRRLLESMFVRRGWRIVKWQDDDAQAGKGFIHLRPNAGLR